MTHTYTEKEKQLYPEGYFEARRKCSSKLLAVFDAQCPTEPSSSLMPSNSPAGQLYFLSNVALMGMPALFLGLKNYTQASLREQLSRALIRISNHPERLAITQESACIEALQDHILTFTDFSNCPIDKLKAILQPSNYAFLRKDVHDISILKEKLQRELSQNFPQNNRENVDKHYLIQKEKIEQCETLIAKLRRSNYTFNIDQYIPQQIKAEKQALLEQEQRAYIEQWKSLVSRFTGHIDTIQLKIDRMKNQDRSEHQALLYIEAAEELHITLSSAKDVLALILQQPNAYQQIRPASIRFVQTCEQAIKKADLFLKKQDHTYGWHHLFADILNTLIFTMTLSLSYWTTGKFHLFTPSMPPIKKEAHALSKSLHKELEMYERESESLNSDMQGKIM